MSSIHTIDNSPNLLSPTVPIGSTAIELVVFEIAEVSFGIPMTKINRVISNIFLGEDYSLTQDVEIVDLHQRITGIEIANFNAIVIFTGTDGRLYGIPIETVPSLTTIPLDRIRTIPQDLRTKNPLGIASHVAIIANADLELTIFILA
jgi:chemotaxis signal transduction protein